jgi:hypothetical protein
MTHLSKKLNSSNESGNVLFLILIAVVLFAALSYAVTQTSRSGSGTDDGALIDAAQVSQYPASVRTSLIRMMVDGVQPADMEFNAPADFADLDNARAGVFHPTGGKATYVLASGDFMESATQTAWTFNMRNQINLIGLTNGTTVPNAASADLIAFLSGITDGLCTKINTDVGITTTPADTDIILTNQEDGTAVVYDGDTIGGAGSTALNGQPYGCFTQGGANVYYHVMVER